MTDEKSVEVLIGAANDGIDCDGLRVEVKDDRYVFETPTSAWTGLTVTELRNQIRAHPEYLSNWIFWHRIVTETARYPFLRWLERADSIDVEERYNRLQNGIDRTWGQLLITAQIGDTGERRYSLRHVADGEATGSDLDRQSDPLAARSIAKYDGDNRYRPLKTAPTLKHGWLIESLDHETIVEAIDLIYPATIANWSLEQAEKLDVTHWNETADRQTGIYDIVDELPPESVDRAVRSCCVDEYCLKRRRWDYDEQREIDVPRGVGEFPCREPCSIFIAGARAWTLAERNSNRTFTVELTTAEREHLRTILETVARGSVDNHRVGDFTDLMNPYRVRYLLDTLSDELTDDR